MKSRKVHILDRKTQHPFLSHGLARTLCGLETGRVLGVCVGARLSTAAVEATCDKCRKAKAKARS